MSAEGRRVPASVGVKGCRSLLSGPSDAMKIIRKSMNLKGRMAGISVQVTDYKWVVYKNIENKGVTRIRAFGDFAHRPFVRFSCTRKLN